MSRQIPDAEILIATGCAHCPAVLQALSDLIKQGLLRQLQVTNIMVDPQRANELGVRSVPWTRIGPFELEGSYSPAELKQWAQRANNPEGITAYITENLRAGKLQKIESFLQQQPQWLNLLIPMLEQEDLEIQIRIGISAVIESLAGQAKLHTLLPEFARLSEHPNAQIRGDATHHLALLGTDEVRPYLEKRLQDDMEDIREIAREGLEMMDT